MRLNFRYREQHLPEGEGNQRTFRPTVEITNADTGEKLEMITRVEFKMNAVDMLPRLILEVIPERVTIEGAEAEEAPRREFTFTRFA